MKEIYLTKGYKTIVDDADYEWLSVYKWHTHETLQGQIYAATYIKGRKVLMHRLIMHEPDGEVDHKNGSSLVNTQDNLRLATRSQQTANKRILPKDKTSKYRGVTRRGKRWQATISKDNKDRVLGTFDSEQQAAAVWDMAALTAHGDFAVLNFPGLLDIPKEV